MTYWLHSHGFASYPFASYPLHGPDSESGVSGNNMEASGSGPVPLRRRTPTLADKRRTDDEEALLWILLAASEDD